MRSYLPGSFKLFPQGAQCVLGLLFLHREFISAPGSIKQQNHSSHLTVPHMPSQAGREPRGALLQHQQRLFLLLLLVPAGFFSSVNLHRDLLKSILHTVTSLDALKKATFNYPLIQHE